MYSFCILVVLVLVLRALSQYPSPASLRVRGSREHVSPQVMNLLRLPSEIQADLLKPPAPLEIHAFSERNLRVLVSCRDEESGSARWRELVQERLISSRF